MGFERLGGGIEVSIWKYLEVFFVDVTKTCVDRDGDRDGDSDPSGSIIQAAEITSSTSYFSTCSCFAYCSYVFATL